MSLDSLDPSARVKRLGFGAADSSRLGPVIQIFGLAGRSRPNGDIWNPRWQPFVRGPETAGGMSLPRRPMCLDDFIAFLQIDKRRFTQV